MKKVSGVYGIRNTATNKIYVGSACYSIARRWTVHKMNLRRGKHTNKHLQRAWNKDGEEAFEFSILEECDAASCINTEQKWIDHYNSSSPELGYNLAPTAGSMLGWNHSEEDKRHHSRQMKLRHLRQPVGIREQISRQIHSKSTRFKNALTEEQKQEIRRRVIRRGSGKWKEQNPNSTRALAKEFGVSDNTIRRVINEA